MVVLATTTLADLPDSPAPTRPHFQLIQRPATRLETRPIRSGWSRASSPFMGLPTQRTRPALTPGDGESIASVKPRSMGLPVFVHELSTVVAKLPLPSRASRERVAAERPGEGRRGTRRKPCASPITSLGHRLRLGKPFTITAILFVAPAAVGWTRLLARYRPLTRPPADLSRKGRGVGLISSCHYETSTSTKPLATAWKLRARKRRLSSRIAGHC
jgi:hypothetical protein